METETERRVEDVRGEPLDELRFLSHLLVERLHERLPDEFWQHARLARKEARLALVILLRAAVERLARDTETDGQPAVSEQRGKIVLEPAEAITPTTNGLPGSDPAPPAPREEWGISSSASHQRAKIALD